MLHHIQWKLVVLYFNIFAIHFVVNIKYVFMLYNSGDAVLLATIKKCNVISKKKIKVTLFAIPQLW